MKLTRPLTVLAVISLSAWCLGLALSSWPVLGSHSDGIADITFIVSAFAFGCVAGFALRDREAATLQAESLRANRRTAATR